MDMIIFNLLTMRMKFQIIIGLVKQLLTSYENTCKGCCIKNLTFNILLVVVDCFCSHSHHFRLLGLQLYTMHLTFFHILLTKLRNDYTKYILQEI